MAKRRDPDSDLSSEGSDLPPKLRPRPRRAKSKNGARSTSPGTEVQGETSDPADAAMDDPTDIGVEASNDTIRVRRMHRRDINRVWDFLKLVFRGVNQKTVEYQRPRNKQRFTESYDDDGIEQLLFEVSGAIVGYAEVAFEVTGSDNWINPRYFDSRDMRPMFVEELASHPDYQGRGVGSFMLEQLQHLAKLRGCTHLVLEVAENNEPALSFYRKRSFYKLDAALFLAQKIETEPELLPPRTLVERS